MKILVRKGFVSAERSHDILRRSFMRYVAKKKRSIFTYVDSEISEDEFSATMHLTFDSAIYLVKDIKPLIAEFKKEWLKSDFFECTGFAKSQLLDRGWTESSIKKFLGKCDCELENPHYKSGPSMKIFHIDRVLRIESSKNWQDWYEKSIVARMKQSVTSRARADKTRQELFKQVSSFAVNFPAYKKRELYRRAICHYNDMAVVRDKQFADMNCRDFDFLNRISVNYLRHGFNGYESRLERMTGCIGNKSAYIMLKTRILSHIAEKFPYLKTEAIIQQERLKFQNNF